MAGAGIADFKFVLQAKVEIIQRFHRLDEFLESSHVRSVSQGLDNDDGIDERLEGSLVVGVPGDYTFLRHLL